jgi:molybdenum cofactor biosynthesis enzyme MoaA
LRACRAGIRRWQSGDSGHGSEHRPDPVDRVPGRLRGHVARADGLWLLCLYARGGLDLRHPLREGATHDELAHLISTVWSMRADRGAEERLGSQAREVLIPVTALKRDAHLEMHTRGG